MSDQQTGPGDAARVETPAPIEQQTVTPEPGAPPQSTPEQQPGGFDPGELLQRYQELQGQVAQINQTLLSQPDYNQEPQFDPFTGDPLGQQPLDPSDPQQLEQLIDSRMAPIQADLYRRDFDGLMQRYPEMQKSDVGEAVLRSLQGAGYDVQQMVPIPVIEMAYKAYRADQVASQQQPAGDGQGAHLERSGAQVPANPEPDMAGLIKQAAQQRNITFLP